MDTMFPTFRRLLNFRPPIAVGWPWRTTSAQRRSLLRLIATAAEEDIPLSRLIEVWASDESGRQRNRLHHLAALLRDGTPLPDAIEQVRGVLNDEDVLAIRFGMQSGTLSATIRDTLEQRDLAAEYNSSQLRKSIVYLFLVVIVAIGVVTFLQIKIIPQLNYIFQDFNLSAPASLSWSIHLTRVVAKYWFLSALAILAISLLVFTSWPGRQLRSGVAGRLFRPLRELRVADVLQKLSVATQAGRPIAGALSTLARYHFDPTLRHQLLVVRNELEHGVDIWQTMGKLGLLTAPETQVLETAERVGNRPWVLHQLAMLRKRRNVRRMAFWSELAVPAVIILMGAFVLWQSLSIYESLVHIVYSLL